MIAITTKLASFASIIATKCNIHTCKTNFMVHCDNATATDTATATAVAAFVHATLQETLNEYGEEKESESEGWREREA